MDPLQVRLVSVRVRPAAFCQTWKQCCARPAEGCGVGLAGEVGEPVGLQICVSGGPGCIPEPHECLRPLQVLASELLKPPSCPAVATPYC